jgi:hypothetical protein
MRLSLLPTVLLALPLPVAALVYTRPHCGCGTTEASAVTPERSSDSACCRQETNVAGRERTAETDNLPINPDRQIVFQVEGLTCPAVKGIGCGHMLQSVLASLDRVGGARASSANYTGTMIRVSLSHGAPACRVREAVRRVLARENYKAVRLAGDELKRALDQEQWREAARIGELSAIEFHTLASHRVQTFARSEKLDKKTADRLLAIAEQQWARICNEAANDGATQPEDWRKRMRAALPAFVERAREVLTVEQVEVLEQTLNGECCDGACPEAPPAPVRSSLPTI